MPNKGIVVTSVIVYVVITLVVAALVFAAATYVFGRNELLPAVPKGGTVTSLPEDDITGKDVRGLRFQVTARGYNMTEVDWALSELSKEIESLRKQVADSQPATTASQ